MQFKLLLSTVLLLGSTSSYAAYCYNAKGKGVIDNVNYDLSETFNSSNQVGKVIEINKNPTQQINAICEIVLWEPLTNSTQRIYTPIELNVVETSDNFQYLKINDYLIGAMRIHDSYAGYFFPPGVFQMGSHPNVSKGQPFPVNDTNLTFRIKVIKPFIGSVSISPKTLFTVKAITNDSDYGGPIIYTISYSGRVIAPQSCKIDSGKILEIKFGDIAASDFSEVGAGNKPNGVDPQTRSISVQCSNMNATATLVLRIEADKSKDDMLVSSNSDIGFKISDSNNKILIPNNLNSTSPFVLNQSKAIVSLKAWPVSINGNKPALGPFSSRAYIRIDFP